MAFCTKCGHMISEGAKFCDYCGAPVNEAEPTTQRTNPVENHTETFNEPVYPTNEEIVPPAQKPSNGIAIASLVLGILAVIGIFASWHPIFAIFILIFAILAICFGASGMKKAKAAGLTNGMAVAGLICGIVATVAAFLSLVCWGACTATICANADYFTSMPESIKDAFHP